jgi:futalosine hydrolase
MAPPRILPTLLSCYAAPLEGDAIAQALGGALRLGVGKTAAAATLAAHLSNGSLPQCIVLFGVGGAFPPAHLAPGAPPLGLLDLALIDSDLLADDGVATDERFVPLDELGLGTTGPFAMDAEWTAIASEAIDAARVRGATVSAGSGSEATSAAIAARSTASIESMEGAAVALVAARFAVPLVQLRCVSNLTGKRATAPWQLQDAVAKVQAAALELAAEFQRRLSSR